MSASTVTTRANRPSLGTAEGVRRTTMASPVGQLTLYAGERGLRAVLWPGEADAFGLDVSEMIASSSDAASGVLRAAVGQLNEYFAGTRRQFDVALDPQGSEFQQAAWKVLSGIAYGTTITYAEQARRMGDVNKSRAVGGANGRNPISIIVPCHRVVGADGTLTGYAGGVEAKRWLLQHEHRA